MTDILMSPRSKPPVKAQHPWPDSITLLQGGESGLVVGGKDGPYTTAFVEAFGEDTGFIRGEGENIAAAEDDCWAKAQQALGCPGHEWEARRYKNGGGICKHCGRFGSHVFTPEQLGLFCAACGVPTFWHSEHHEPVGEFFTCEAHVPHAEGRWCFCPPCRAKELANREALTDADLTKALEGLFGP